MTGSRDPDRLIAAYLEDGPTELARDSYEAVDRRIQRTRQRAGFGPWRDLHMSNNLARAVLGVAAVVVAAVIGAGLLRPGGFAGTGSPTASPSLVSGPSASPLGSSTQGSAMAQPPLYVWPTGMAPGTYTTSFVWDPALQFTFTVPAGWRSLDINVAKNDRISLVFFPIDDVAGKTCASPTPTRAPVWTGDAVLAALGKLVTFDGPPSDARVAGRDARYVEFTARPVVGCATAGNVLFRTPTPRCQPDVCGGAGPPTFGLEFGAVAHHERLWLMDVGRTIVAMNAVWTDEATPSELAELQSVIDSVRLDTPLATSPPGPSGG
jgi:hypothetical protein